MLKAINRRASEILRGEDKNASAGEADEWPVLRIELSREEIRAAAIIAQQRLGWPDAAVVPNRNVTASNDMEA
ncbi:hypothetical protein [Massilia rubra]|uniref:Uncharacterized protein n=1 Tax=Massilia rubra TaxID=2607910 RepID=A0ABX0LZE2_9BURK|nr:hypothetical protein [Massilia rubra]NHZ37472.1 hypothetical protein [Massilia rubra]